MPTGYTAQLSEKKDMSFSEFALLCTRAMGIAVELRDENLSVPTPKYFEVSDYHSKRLKEYKHELEILQKTPIEELERKAYNEYNESVLHYKKEIKKANKLKEIYENMLKKVNDWIPPTEEHEGLKKFMIEQLESSINYDCDSSYYDLNKLKLESGEDYFKNKKREIINSIDYHIEQNLKENERVQSKNEWMKMLLKSLNIQ